MAVERRQATRWAVMLAALGAAPLACKSAPPAVAAAAPQPIAPGSVLRYLPLENDSVFAYATYLEDTNERGLAVIEIHRPRPDLAELSVAGQVRKRYRIASDALEGLTGGYVLKAPIQLGAEWRGEDGRVRVSAVDQTVSVPAGRFSGCIETVEEATLLGGWRRTTTGYCPGVGIVRLHIEAESSEASVSQRLELKSFGPRFTP